MSTATPYASIIVPTHDRASTLASAIDSIQQQSVADIEILIVGDGASEAVRSIACKLAANDSRIGFLDWPKAPGRGGRNRDRAINLARGERIFYCDDDDLFLPDHVETLGAALDDSECADTQAASVSLCGYVQLAFTNHRRGLVRDALASGRARATFDTHFAHRKATYHRLGPLWTADSQKIAAKFLGGFASAPAVTWRTVSQVTALSFHGAARRHLSGEQRVAELAFWSKKLSRQLASELSCTGQYDWHIFTLANALTPSAKDLTSFLGGSHVGIAIDSECGGADVVFSLSPRQIDDITNVFALLNDGAVERANIVPLALRLTDALVGTRPRHTVVARLLARALGHDIAIAELKTHTAPDPYSREMSEYLLLRLLVEAGHYDEAQVRLEKLLTSSRRCPAVGHAVGADLARRRNDPSEALRHAATARDIDPHLPEGYEPLVWALAKSRRIDEAQLAVEEADTNFADDRFTQRLASIANKAVGTRAPDFAI